MPPDALTKLKLDMNDMKNDVKNIASDVADLKETLDKFIEKSETRYAGKWAEKALVAIFSTVGLAVLAAILSLIIINR